MNNSETQSLEDVFGPVIASYSRAQAIDDGVLIDVTPMAREAGFKWPVALTHTAWCDCVAWTERDNRSQVYQDESGRFGMCCSWRSTPFEQRRRRVIGCDSRCIACRKTGDPRKPRR